MKELKKLSKNLKKMVLIDDDVQFCTIMAHYATSRGLTLDYYSDLQEMGSLGKLSEYDVAIVDYDLGSINGVEIAEYLPIFFGDMPMILVSGRTRNESGDKKWPRSIKRFVHKDVGPDEILDSAINLLPDSGTLQKYMS